MLVKQRQSFVCCVKIWHKYDIDITYENQLGKAMTDESWVKVLEIVKSRLPKDYQLSGVQLTGLQAAWERKGYREFARRGFSEGYLSNSLIPVYALLSESFGETVRKNNFREIIENSILGKVFFEEVPNSPAVFGTPPKIDSFVGRDKEKEFLEYTYSEQKVIFINGCEGIGKTALTSDFFQKISKTNNFLKYIWYAPSETSIEDNIVQINKLLDSKKSLLSLSDFHEYISANKIFIVIDGIDLWLSNYLDETTTLIKRTVDLHHNSLIIFTLRNTLDWFKYLQQQGYPIKSIKLEGLTIDATRQLFKLQGIEDKRIDQIFDSNRGNPFAILDACKKIQFMNGDLDQYIRFKTLFLTRSSRERLDKIFTIETSKVKLRERHILFLLMQASSGTSVNKGAAIDLVEGNTNYDLPEIIESLEILLENSLISIDKTNPLSLLKHDEVRGYIAQDPLKLFHFENNL